MSTLFVSDPTNSDFDLQNDSTNTNPGDDSWGIRRRARSIVNPPGALVALSALGGLLFYLIVRQFLDPGYTDFLGYMVMQDAIAILFLLWLGLWLAPESQISRLTYTLVVAEVWADSLGNAVHLYGAYPAYDKVTHLLGGMAITAVAADLLFGLKRKHCHNWSYRRLILGAAAISMGFCVGWELYEYFGDRLIHSSRWKGWDDTNGDLIADSLGVFIVLSAKLVLDPFRWRINPFGHHLVRQCNETESTSGVRARRTVIARPRPFAHSHVRSYLLDARHRERLRGRHGDLVRMSLWCGIIAPVMALLLIGLAAVATPHYSDFSDTISDLADQGQPHGYLVRIDLFVFGLATLAFGLGLGAVLPRWRTAVRILFVIFGFSVAMAGLFRDYGEGPNMPRNREGFTHNTFGVTAIVAIVIAMIATTSIGSRSHEWRPLLWSSITGIFLISTSGLLFLWGPVSLQGLVERIIYLAAGIWMMNAAHVALRSEVMSQDRQIPRRRALPHRQT